MSSGSSLGELWSRVWPLVLVLVVAVGGWLALSDVAYQARQKDATETVKGPNTDDYDTAKKWATALLGLAGTFAGFLGIAAAAQNRPVRMAVERAQIAEGGLVGILAGATLLGVGGVGVPVALAVLIAGGTTVRVTRALKSRPRDEVHAT